MSADNWTVCPRCKLRHEKEAERLRAEADADFGKIPLADWRVKDAAAGAMSSATFTEPTFREDYELGVYDGGFYVSYMGSCSACNLSVTFKHEAPIEGVDS